MSKVKTIEQIEVDLKDLCDDYNIRLVRRDDLTVGVDVPFDEFMDVIAKKSAAIVLKKFLSKK